MNIAFDAITDEGGSKPTKFVLDSISNPGSHSSFHSPNPYGVSEFTKKLMDSLKD